MVTTQSLAVLGNVPVEQSCCRQRLSLLRAWPEAGVTAPPPSHPLRLSLGLLQERAVPGLKSKQTSVNAFHRPPGMATLQKA